MRTNNLPTYILYAILAGIILIAGYKACQIRTEQAQRAKENAELDQVMRDFGYTDDSTSAGSSYMGGDSATTSAARPKPDGTATTAPKVSASGIEDETPATSARQTTPPASQPSATRSQPATTTKTAPASPGLTPKAPVYTGKYLVITGAFRQKQNARDEMETLVKSGYRNAEVKQFTSAWAHVIALRTNDRAAADRAVEKLKSEGYPGAYVKTQ